MSDLIKAEAVWHLDEVRSDRHLVQEALELAGHPNAPTEANQVLQNLYEQQMTFYPSMMKQVEERAFPDASEQPYDLETIYHWEYTVTRLMFQYRQHQFVRQLLKPALDANNGQWAKMGWLMTEIAPGIPAALESEETLYQSWDMPLEEITEMEMKSEIISVMLTTVAKAHKELGLPENTVYPKWMEMNQQADSRTLQRKVQLYLEWGRSGKYPPTFHDLIRVFKTEQQQAVNDVIYEELTEPIIAKSLDEEENISRAEDLL